MIFKFLIYLYRLVNPGMKMIFGIQGNCLYSPSCSEYTEQSIEKFGSFRGLGLGLKRVSQCHTFARNFHKELIEWKKI